MLWPVVRFHSVYIPIIPSLRCGERVRMVTLEEAEAEIGPVTVDGDGKDATRVSDDQCGSEDKLL
jgi:hypothetical protein